MKSRLASVSVKFTYTMIQETTFCGCDTIYEKTICSIILRPASPFKAEALAHPRGHFISSDSVQPFSSTRIVSGIAVRAPLGLSNEASLRGEFQLKGSVPESCVINPKE